MTATLLSASAVRLPSTSAVLIGADRARRRALAEALRRLSVRIKAELDRFPSLDAVCALTEQDCDAVVIDLEEDRQAALGLGEQLCRRNAALTAIVYSRSDDPHLLVECMRAGARDLIREPLSEDAPPEVVRPVAPRGVASRRPAHGKD